jgi:hypothetical protein
MPVYNQRFMDPPLGLSELNAVVKSVSKKNYTYMCKQEPICSVCNRAVCLTRKYGVGGGDDPGVVFGRLVKIETEPPTYFWDVDGRRLEITVEELLDQRKLQRTIVAKLDKLPSLVKPSTWAGIIRERLETIEVVSVPEDATHAGQFWLHVERFCTGRVRGRSMDELLLGKPYEEHGRIYFCSSDLMQYLAQHRFNSCSEKDVFKWLRDRGVEHHQKNIKGRHLNCWSVPAFKRQTEEYAVPRAQPPEVM